MINPFFNHFLKKRRSIEQSLYSPKSAVVKQYIGSKTISCPPPRAIDDTLTTLISNRKSNRQFVGTHITLEELSTVLYWSAGELPDIADYPGRRRANPRRPHPSGGAKYPLELYVCADAVEGLNKGMYHYRVDTHSLELVSDLSQEEILALKKTYQGHAFVMNVPALIVFSYNAERNVPKYGALGYKLGLIEAGHIGQNMHLTASGLSLRCVALGSLGVEQFNHALALDGYVETTFFSVGLSK